MNARWMLFAAMCFVGGVSAQVQPVGLTNGPTNWPLIGFALACVAIVLGFAYWKHKATPDQEAKAKADAQAAMASALEKAHESIAWLHDHLATALARIPEPSKAAPQPAPAVPDVPTAAQVPENAATGPETAPAAVPALSQAEQMAAVAAARQAYLTACAKAGVNPLPTAGA